MLIAFAFVAGGVAAILAGLAQRGRLIAARRWATVDGEIHFARVIEEDDMTADVGGKRYRADVRYCYTVNGVEHTGSRRQLIVLESLSRAHAQEVVQHYPPGHRVRVHYDPANPADAALEVPTRSIVPVLFILAGVVISGVGGVQVVVRTVIRL